MFEITPTDTQKELLGTFQFSLAALNADDFVGEQPYIDKWISRWFDREDVVPPCDLPLCVEESIYCDKKLMRLYKTFIISAIASNRVSYLKRHFIVPLPKKQWDVVNLFTISNELADYLWEKNPAPRSMASFIVEARHSRLWKHFVDFHGPTPCLYHAVSQQWPWGVKHCIDQGADVDPACMKAGMVHEIIFSLLVPYSVPPRQDAWEEFRLQNMMGRTTAAVEEWFWIHGFRL